MQHEIMLLHVCLRSNYNSREKDQDIIGTYRCAKPSLHPLDDGDDDDAKDDVEDDDDDNDDDEVLVSPVPIW